MERMREPITINHMTLKNRLVMPPMATSRSEDGTVNQKLLEYYDEKSAGGYIGLIITEHSYVHPQGIANPGQISISRDSDVEGLRQLVQVIHKNGSKVMAQINHAGSAARRAVTGLEPVSSSAVVNEAKHGADGETPRELTREEIAQIVRDFAAAARRAKEAGYDGVEIHSAHGYLLNQFYSPLANRRSDEYGPAAMEGRLRIHREIIQAVRAQVGEDYPVALRLGGCDYAEGGSTVEDSVEAAMLLESWGIDLLDISGGMNGYIIPGKNEPGYFADMSEAIKKRVSIPVILTGGITEFAAAEELQQAGKADLIGVGRAILKDSLWAKRAMQGPVEFEYWKGAPAEAHKEWRRIMENNLRQSHAFEIHCWEDESEAVRMALSYGTVKMSNWKQGTVIEGKVTQDFTDFLLSLPVPEGNDLTPRRMTPFFSIFLDNGFSSEHYGTELNQQ